MINSRISKLENGIRSVKRPGRVSNSASHGERMTRYISGSILTSPTMKRPTISVIANTGINKPRKFPLEPQWSNRNKK